MNEAGLARRPIRQRDTGWARAITRWLVAGKVRPNFISVLSFAFASMAGAALFAVPYVDACWASVLYFVAALCIPIRLLCNMFDGMVAVEGGFRTKLGDLYNELPDRLSDVIVIVGAGYSTHHLCGITLGWGGAVVAVLTAYVRALGGVAGAVQPFCGPMAKQQRMILVVVGAILSIVEILIGWPPRVMTLVLFIILIGSIITVYRRTCIIAKDLQSK